MSTWALGGEWEVQKWTFCLKQNLRGQEKGCRFTTVLQGSGGGGGIMHWMMKVVGRKKYPWFVADILEMLKISSIYNFCSAVFFSILLLFVFFGCTQNTTTERRSCLLGFLWVNTLGVMFVLNWTCVKDSRNAVGTFQIFFIKRGWLYDGDGCSFCLLLLQCSPLFGLKFAGFKRMQEGASNK